MFLLSRCFALFLLFGCFLGLPLLLEVLSEVVSNNYLRIRVHFLGHLTEVVKVFVHLDSSLDIELSHFFTNEFLYDVCSFGFY